MRIRIFLAKRHLPNAFATMNENKTGNSVLMPTHIPIQHRWKGKKIPKSIEENGTWKQAPTKMWNGYVIIRICIIIVCACESCVVFLKASTRFTRENVVRHRNGGWWVRFDLRADEQWMFIFWPNLFKRRFMDTLCLFAWLLLFPILQTISIIMLSLTLYLYGCKFDFYCVVCRCVRATYIYTHSDFCSELHLRCWVFHYSIILD